MVLTGGTTGTVTAYAGNPYPGGRSSLGEDIDLDFHMVMNPAKPVLTISNGVSPMVVVDGPENNGTVAALKITSGSQQMLLDGNEIDSNGPLYLNHNSLADVHVPALVIDGGADLAEPFQISNDSKDPAPPGSVMVIDELNPGHLKLSTRAYDHHVAGIISGAGGVNPGLTLQQKNALGSGVNVALTGRVYVKATAAQGAIQPGDLLTTADLPGYAAKVADRDRAAGAIIGKAMTALEKGEGLVLVLVSLQ